MFDTQDFQGSGATVTGHDAVSAAPLQLPATLKEIAEYEGISYNTLKNNYFAPKIEPIYSGFECPALKSENGKLITEFGYQAIQRYVMKVVKGKQDYSAYMSDVRSKLSPLQAPDPIEPEATQKSSSTALVRRSSTLARRSYTQHDSSALVSEIEADVLNLVETGESNFLDSRNALVQRFAAMGDADAAIAYEAYQSGFQSKFSTLADQTEKKQELVTE
ncbi:MAG: hypothetical protein KME15_27740 [Drouetiella hepatica Uher 2000/2452]|jgi:hypothetical protein|uniref:Uncharacterized protein n=1 Tax=Drouetiella hepatica Uher 2000/2452 TaxID=904376 RepID=A0A951QFZ4_9CYAN|nr:hypothetical protein [Drouetiella hepatica Uher 2000/2452]